VDILKEIAKLNQQGIDIQLLRTDTYDNEEEEVMLKITASWKIPDSDNKIGKGFVIPCVVYNSLENAHDWVINYLQAIYNSIEDYKKEKGIADDKREDS